MKRNKGMKFRIYKKGDVTPSYLPYLHNKVLKKKYSRPDMCRNVVKYFVTFISCIFACTSPLLIRYNISNSSNEAAIFSAVGALYLKYFVYNCRFPRIPCCLVVLEAVSSVSRWREMVKKTRI